MLESAMLKPELRVAQWWNKGGGSPDLVLPGPFTFSEMLPVVSPGKSKMEGDDSEPLMYYPVFYPLTGSGTRRGRLWIFFFYSTYILCQCLHALCPSIMRRRVISNFMEGNLWFLPSLLCGVLIYWVKLVKSSCSKQSSALILPTGSYFGYQKLIMNVLPLCIPAVTTLSLSQPNGTTGRIAGILIEGNRNKSH